MQNYPPQMQDLAVSSTHNNSVFVSDFTCFARFMAFTEDTLYENMNKTRKVRKRVHFCVHGSNEQNPYTCTIL